MMAETGNAQTGPPLQIFRNFFVTGDYVVAGWLENAPDGSGYASGTISVPDTLQASRANQPLQSVPPGAEIVAAYLYWSTVESNQDAFSGRQAFFNGYKIDGGPGLNPTAPTSWSSGGCSGGAMGTKTMRVYRTDVRAYLPIDNIRFLADGTPNPTFGNIMANGQFSVSLRDSGSNGNTTPFTLGASLVIIYRLPVSTYSSLNSIVIYDGAYAPANNTANFSQNLVGFYQAAAAPVSKITHIVANGQSNKNEKVYLAAPNANLSLVQPLPSLYGTSPAFPGVYNLHGSDWDNPTWFLNSLPNNLPNPVQANDSIKTASVAPGQNNQGCVNWGAVILSTTVQSSDNDGLLDVWKTYKDGNGNSVPGYVDVIPIVVNPNDPSSNQYQWVSLPGADTNAGIANMPHWKDVFVELDYLDDSNGTTPGTLPNTFLPSHTHLPQKLVLDQVASTFANQGVHVHFDLGPTPPGILANDTNVVSYSMAVPSPLPPKPDPLAPGNVVAPPATVGGNNISESTTYCADTGSLCQFPNQASVAWKGGLLFLRDSPAYGSFQQGRQNSYRYALFGHALGEARSFWSTAAYYVNNLNTGNVIGNSIDSVVVNGAGLATITLETPAPAPPEGTVKPGDCPNV
ncbi:MAG TPA: hypothetical protein VNH18_09510, partial [Bryobacteraceae bacterium]|nr:hypothetical protein [Bryobacteraceae bacterium]